MKIRWVVLIAVVSLIVGAGGAWWYSTNLWTSFVNVGLVARTEADITTRVAILERLRAGKFDEAIHLQEILLDGDLISAGALVREGRNFHPNTRRAVELEAKARTVSGYQPNPSIRDAVDEAFRLVPMAVDDSTRRAQ